MRNLEEIFLECESELLSIGIVCGRVDKITVNTRAKSRFGLCKKVGKDSFEISIAAALLEESSELSCLKNTIVHELLHTVEGCFNHKGKWKLLAKKVNTELEGYDVKRVASFEENGVKLRKADPQFKYCLKCESCGAEIYRQRESKAVKNYKRYRCAKCGGRLTRIL